jgi:hypothetical protein
MNIRILALAAALACGLASPGWAACTATPAAGFPSGGGTSLATQTQGAVTITGGCIDGVTLGGNVAVGPITSNGEIRASGILRSTNAALANLASSVGIDQASSTVSRMFAWGPDASTPGKIAWTLDSSDGSITNTQMALGPGLQIGAPTGTDKGAGTVNVAAAIYNNGALLASATPPTIASGGCTTGSAQSVSASNGSAAFEITIGGATCGSTITLTMPAAAHNWVCDAHNITNPATNALDMTGAASTTAVVLTNFVRTTGVAGNFTGADKLAIKCLPY